MATASMELFQRFVKYLKGPHVWGYVMKHRHGQLLASPHIGHVLGYDMAIREQVAAAMNRGKDIKAAFEEALADKDPRHVSVTGAYRNDTETAECQGDTVPGLAKRCPQLRRKKRPLALAYGNVNNSGGQTSAAEKIKLQKARQRASRAATRNTQQQQNVGQVQNRGGAVNRVNKGAGKGGNNGK